jgi:hypothetical protein
MQNVITHDGLTIDLSKATRAGGPVTLVFRDTVDQIVTKITANFTGDDLVDFEGEPEEGDAIYTFCEMQAKGWAEEIADKLERLPGHLIATQADVSRAA